MWGDLDGTAETLVVSAGSSYTVNGTQYGGLHIYKKSPTNTSYILTQTLTTPLYQTSLKSQQPVLSPSSLLLLIQAEDQNRKYQLLYTRNSINDNFVLADVIGGDVVGAEGSVGERGIGFGEEEGGGGRVLVVPGNGRELMVYYCEQIYVAPSNTTDNSTDNSTDNTTDNTTNNTTDNTTDNSQPQPSPQTTPQPSS